MATRKKQRPRLSGCPRNEAVEACLAWIEQRLQKGTTASVFEAGMMLALIEGNGIATAAQSIGAQVSKYKAG
jgi:hypothetical protein